MAEIVTGAGAPPVADVGAVSPAKIFWATWFGWMLDGFDSSMYGYILVGALSELLPASGIEASRANIGLYGGLLFSIFMLGWACSMVWGWAADRYGRVRIMCWTVLVYSVFTALCGLSTGLVMFGLFRFVAGFGIGGEWAAGTPLLHESVPETPGCGWPAGCIPQPRPGCSWRRWSRSAREACSAGAACFSSASCRRS